MPHPYIVKIFPEDVDTLIANPKVCASMQKTPAEDLSDDSFEEYIPPQISSSSAITSSSESGSSQQRSGSNLEYSFVIKTPAQPQPSGALIPRFKELNSNKGTIAES